MNGPPALSRIPLWVIPALLIGIVIGWMLRDGLASGGEAAKPDTPAVQSAGTSAAREGAAKGAIGTNPADAAEPVSSPKTPRNLFTEWRDGGMGADELGWRLLSLAESAPAGELTAMAEWARAAELPLEIRKRLFEGIGRNPAVNPEILRGILTAEALKDWQVCAGLADGLAEGGVARLEMIKGLFGDNQRRVLRLAEGLALVRDRGFKGAMEEASAAGLPNNPSEDVGQSIRTDRVFSEALAMGPALAKEMIETASKAPNGGDGIASHFAAKLARTDPRGSLEWITTLPRETRGEVVMGVFGGAAAKDPEYALEFLSRFSSSDLEQESILYAMKSTFSETDPERAAQCEALLAELESRRKAR